MLKSLINKIKRPRPEKADKVAAKADAKSGPKSDPRSATKPSAQHEQSVPQSTEKKSSAPKKKRRKKSSASENAPTQAAQISGNWRLEDFDVPPEEGKTRFHDFDLPEPLMHAIHDLGFSYCSPIQAQILPHTLRGSDAIGKAQTGTGKTAAFLIAVIDELINYPYEDDRRPKEPRALIVAPTRELVMQIAKDAENLCKHTGFNVVALIGGADYSKQKQAMNRGFVDIVVATPGRLIDFMTRNDVFLDHIEMLVLDEADRMLDMGFIPQVRRIVRATPRREDRQTQLFSATFDENILRLAAQWTFEPVTVEIEPERIATETVEQIGYMVAESEKIDVLKKILKQPETELTIVFANRRDQTQYVYKKLQEAGFEVGILSGEIAQDKRTRTLKNFKEKKITVLIATDVVGRGIHIDGITHVVNFDLPEDPEDYIHRIGRTGRAGESGIAISLVCEDGAFQLPAIESLMGKKLPCIVPPEALN